MKRMQFSQKQCIFANILVVLVYLGSFILSWCGKQPISDVGIAIVSAYGVFATGGYFALSGARDCSKNKHADKLAKD